MSNIKTGSKDANSGLALKQIASYEYMVSQSNSL